MRRASAPSSASRRTAAANASRIAGGDEQRALAVDEQLARGRRVGRHERRPARERLERLVRDHAARLRRGAEDAERAAGTLDLLRQLLVLDPLDPLDVRRALAHQRVELAAADDAEGELRREPGRGEDRLERRAAGSACRRRGRGSPARAATRPEEALLGADEADGEPFGGELAQLGEVPRVLRGVGDDEVGAPQRQTVDLAQDACGGRARPRSGGGPRPASRAARRAG